MEVNVLSYSNPHGMFCCNVRPFMIYALFSYIVSVVAEAWALLSMNYATYICMYVLFQFLLFWGFSALFMDPEKLRSETRLTKPVTDSDTLCRRIKNFFVHPDVYLSFTMIGFLVTTVLFGYLSTPAHTTLTSEMALAVFNNEFFHIGVSSFSLLGVAFLFFYVIRQLCIHHGGTSNGSTSNGSTIEETNKPTVRIIWPWWHRLLVGALIGILRTLVPIFSELGLSMIKDGIFSIGFIPLAIAIICFCSLFLAKMSYAHFFIDQLELYMIVFQVFQWFNLFVSYFFFETFDQSISLEYLCLLQLPITLFAILNVHSISRKDRLLLTHLTNGDPKLSRRPLFLIYRRSTKTKYHDY